jgi:hypothetical protein
MEQSEVLGRISAKHLLAIDVNMCVPSGHPTPHRLQSDARQTFQLAEAGSSFGIGLVC